MTSSTLNDEDIEKLIISDDLPDEPAFKAYIEAKVYDKEGHLIQHLRQPMRSLTQYFLALMSALLAGTFSSPSSNTAQPLLTSVLGLPSSISNSSGCAGIAWVYTIQVGSGSQPFSVTLNSLAAPIANGSGEGQLLYTNFSTTYSQTSDYFTITTYNATSSTITVTEIGLIGTIYKYCGSCSPTSSNFLFSYDTFSSPIPIPSSGLAMFEIIISFSG